MAEQKWPSHVWLFLFLAVLTLGSGVYGNYLQRAQLDLMRSPPPTQVPGSDISKPVPSEGTMQLGLILSAVSPIVTGILLLSAVLVAFRSVNAKHDGLMIQSAKWGKGNLPWEYRRITKLVRESVRDGKLDIPATIQHLGDPFRDTPKHLTVRYFLNGVPMTAIKAEGERLVLPEVHEPQANHVRLPQTPVAEAVDRKFKLLSLSRKIMVKYAYEHPNTSEAFLLPILNGFGYPPRVAVEALQALLTETNFFVRDGHAQILPNPEIRDVVVALIQDYAWPSVLLVKDIASEVVKAVKADAISDCVTPVQWSYLTLQNTAYDPSKPESTDTYRDKVRFTITNGGKDIQIWSPLWESTQVHPQLPLGSKLRMNGSQQEEGCLSLKPGESFTGWLGLTQSHGEGLSVRVNKGNTGALVFPMKIEGKLTYERVQI